MKSFIIGPNDAGQRLDKFISKAAPLLPQALMYKYIRIKRIKVDGKRAQISTRLTAGCEVELYINDEFLNPRRNATTSSPPPKILRFSTRTKTYCCWTKRPAYSPTPGTVSMGII